MVRVREIDEKDRVFWDLKLSEIKSVHPLNAYAWGKVRSVDGWEPTYLICERGTDITGAVLLLTKQIPLMGLSIIYAPRGPVFCLNDNETLKALLHRVRLQSKKKNAIFLRIDPNILESDLQGGRDPFLNAGFIHLSNRWSMWNTPRDVYRIDLTKHENEDSLFMSLDRQARKAVRKAMKEGVTIRQASTLGEFNSFYRMFKQFTIERGFMSRGYDYQRCLWDEYIMRGNGSLFLAFYNGKIIGGILSLIFGKKCLAMHMGTPLKYRELRSNDAYVWEAIKWAKNCGCTWFSFRGVGSSPTEKKFKEKFGPKEVPLAGYYDLPFFPLLYKISCQIEFKLIPRMVLMVTAIRKISSHLTKRLSGRN